MLHHQFNGLARTVFIGFNYYVYALAIGLRCSYAHTCSGIVLGLYHAILGYRCIYACRYLTNLTVNGYIVSACTRGHSYGKFARKRLGEVNGLLQEWLTD